MKPILYPASETEFTSNGLGRLSDAIRCTVTEERNGPYELELTYPVTGLHYADIREERIIAATHDETGDIQPFRIYKITRPMDGKVTVFARHISYQLSKVVVMPFTTSGCSAALLGLKNNAVGDCPFTFWTDKTNSNNFSVETPASLRSLLGGTEGSILDIFGPGEYEWDRYTVKFHSHRGSDTGITIRYGKDLMDVKKTTTTESFWTGIVPFWKGLVGEMETMVTLPEKAVYAAQASGTAVIPVDFSSAFQSQPTEEQLRTCAQSYVEANYSSVIPSSIDVSFVALWQTEEYKNVAPLQRLRLCDTVSVVHRALGVENQAKIVATTYNVLLDRYDRMTIGDVRANLTDTIRAISEELKKETPTISDIQRITAHATSLITGGLGGHVVINTNANGQPNEILILDTESINTAIRVLRINQNGIGFSSSGYNGPYRSAWTLDGAFVADFITTGTLSAALLRTGTISDANGNALINLDNGTINLNGQVTANNNVEITADGKLIAVAGEFSGEVNAEEGQIGGFTIGATSLTYRTPQIIPVSTNEDTNIYIGQRGISVDSKHNTEFYDRRGISLEDGKLCIYQDAAIAAYLASKEDQVSSVDHAPQFRCYLNSRNSVRVNNEDKWWTFFAGNGANNWITGWEIIENLQSSDGQRVGHHTVHGDFTVYEDFSCHGTKNRIASTADFGERKLYCYETASPMFGDVGEGVVSSDGTCLIDIDPIFEETVETSQYQVFLQAYSPGDLWVSERGVHSFTVSGTPGLRFGWEIKARQLDFSQLRLDALRASIDDPGTDYNQTNVVQDYGADAAAYIEEQLEQKTAAI